VRSRCDRRAARNSTLTPFSPAGGAARAANAAPTYTQDEQHDLDRLIQQQQNSK
jgi:hypothetical protein